MSKLVSLDFPKQSKEFNALEEYLKLVDCNSVSCERLFVTTDSVFTSGIKEEEKVRRFSGNDFRIWTTDKAIIDVFDVWKLRPRTGEQVTCVKMENHYNPLSEESAEAYTSHTPYSAVDCLFLCIPWKLKNRLNSNIIQFLDIEEALFKCEHLMNHSAEDVDRFLFRNLYNQIKASNKKFCVFLFDGQKADADYDLLSMIYYGCTDFHLYEQALMESSWQWSVSVFPEVLGEIKHVYFSMLCDGISKPEFFNAILRFRSYCNNLVY